MILISDDHEKIIRDPRRIIMQKLEGRDLYIIKVDGSVFGYYWSHKTALAEMQNISDMMTTNKTYQVHSSDE